MRAAVRQMLWQEFDGGRNSRGLADGVTAVGAAFPRRRLILAGDRVQHFMGARGKAVSTEGLNVVVEWEGGGIELIPAAVIECIEVGT
jgi:hypothetical protein